MTPAASLAIPGDASFALWFKRASSAVPGTLENLLFQGGNTLSGVDVPSSYFANLESGTGRIRAGFEGSSGQDVILTTPAAVLDTAFHHLGYVGQGSQHRIYLDGVQVVEGTFSIFPGNASSLPLAIGAAANAGSFVDFFKGSSMKSPSSIAAHGSRDFATQREWQSADDIYSVAGMTAINGSLIADTVAIDGGVLQGSGDIAGDVSNTSGNIAPGQSPGILDINGDYSQGPDGTLLLEIAGRREDTPTQFDQLRVTGIATLDGTVRVELLNEFEPTPGDEFEVLTAARCGWPVRHSRSAVARRYWPATGSIRCSPEPDARVQFVSSLGFVAAATGGVDDGELTPHQVVLDEFGNSYVTGSFRGSVDFDREHPVPGDILVSATDDGYLAKYGSAGQLLWVKQIHGTSSATGLGITIDHGSAATAADDAIYVTGSFGGSLSYGGAPPRLPRPAASRHSCWRPTQQVPRLASFN